MATLRELVHYCKHPNPLGVFMLTGEWGAGKTHLIETELAETLKDTHVIVRVSMYGMNSIEQLRAAVKEKWVSACSPILGKFVKNKENANRNSGLVNALNAILKGVNPVAGNAADVMVSLNVLDMVTVEPEIEDVHSMEKKRAVLVFDDLERSKLDPIEAMGVINEYCENQHFNTIIVTNEAYRIHTMKDDLMLYHMLKGKTVSRTVFYVPDFDSILSSIIEARPWSSEKYKTYLKEKKDGILELFSSGSIEPEKSFKASVKSHNLFVLTGALEDFYRVYYHLKEAGIENPDPWLYSFLAYALSRKGGVFKNGRLNFDTPDNEIAELYPMFSQEYLPRSIREWVAYGIWDEDRFYQELAAETKKPA